MAVEDTSAGAIQMNGSAGSADVKGTSTNGQEKSYEQFLTEDPHLARYGRYVPSDDDFKPHYDSWWDPEPESASYWEDIVKRYCTPENSLDVPEDREAFAAGSVIIRVDQENANGAAVGRYACANENELESARKAESALREIGVTVPVIYFSGAVEGKNVTVESRIPGVSLDAAWKYLTPKQVEGFKQQCRRIVQCLSAIESPADRPSYVCPGLNSQSQPEVLKEEREILFADKGSDEDFSFTHNNMVPSNIVVKDDRVVGILGWRQSGFFGYQRAGVVHRKCRVDLDLMDEPVDLSAWADLYDDLPQPKKEDAALMQPEVKIEPGVTNLDKFPVSSNAEDSKLGIPQLDGADLPEEHPTPKKIADLKRGSTSRASSSDRSSPVASTKAAVKKAAPGTNKKGTARKPAAKKRKLNEQDGENVDGRRSNTPASSRNSKTPAPKKQGSVSISGSPAPEGKKKGAKNVAVEEQQGEDEDVSEPDILFCICRRPDNHTWMIGCDGGCEDWFHGKCVNIDPRDADLIDKYICPNCKERGKGNTTWKPMCRLPGCRKPARVTRKNPSKYCSDDHGREFMLLKVQHLNITLPGQKKTPVARAAERAKGRSRDGQSTEGEDSHAEDGDDDDEADKMEELGSRGGVLTAGELKAAVMGVSSIEEFRRLGERLISPPPEENEKPSPETKAEGPQAKAEGGKKLGLDIDPPGLVYSADEASKIEKLRKSRNDLLHRRDMLSVRNTLVNLARQRGKSILERLKQAEPKGGWKDICAFDTRLAWSDEEFDEWRLSEAGKKALEEGTPEALAASYPDAMDADGDVAMEDEDDLAALSRGVCTKKRCERHKQWVKVQQQDILFEEDTVREDLARCEREAQAVVERAVLRMWAEKGANGV